MRRLAPLALIGLLAACAPVGPNAAIPPEAVRQQAAAQGPFLGSAAESVSDAPVPAGWWRLFDSPRLNDLEAEALAANRDLRVAQANLAQSQALQLGVEAAQDLTIHAMVAPERAQLSGESYLQPAQLPSQYLGAAEIGVSYQLDLFGRLARAAEAARDDSEAAVAGRDLAQVSVVAAVAARYVEVCAAGHDLTVLHRTIDLQLQSRDIADQLSRAGRESVMAVTRADRLIAQSRALVPPLMARQQAALFSLAVLTGHLPAEFPKDLADCTIVPQLRQPLPVGDGAALLRRRPDIRQADRALAAATARIGVATAALYPDISFGATAGSSGLLADLGKPAAESWSIGPLIRWTLPDRRDDARLQAADAAAKAALAHFDAVVLNALRETESRLTAYREDLNRREALRSAAGKTAETVAQAEQLRRAGRAPSQISLAARQDLANADFALAESDGQIAEDQVALFLALGGGWEAVTAP